MFAILFTPQNAICFGAELLRQSRTTHIAGRMSMYVCTWTNMDLSRWKNIWIARAGADQPPHSSVEQNLEQGKDSSRVFHSRSLSSTSLILNNCLILSWRCWMRTYPLCWTPRILQRAGTRSNRLSSPHVKACKCGPAGEGRGPCGPASRHKWALCPQTPHCQTHIGLLTQQGLPCELLGKCPICA